MASFEDNKKFNDILFLLGIIDNMHDFYDKDIDPELNDSKLLFEYMFYFIIITKMVSIDDLHYDNIKKDIILNLFNNNILFDVDKSNIKEKIKKEIFSIPKPTILITDINDQIIENFNKIFNISTDIIKVNLNSLLNREQKIMLRLQLYYLILNKDDINIRNELIDFILGYINLDIYEDIIIESIKKQIIDNLLNNTFINITYPLTYFDDMTTGLNLKFLRFNILNFDKENIDAATTTQLNTYLNNKDNDKSYRNIIINDENTTIGFNLNNSDKLDFLESLYYLKNKEIICEFKDIKLKVIKNNVGRSEEGIFHDVIKLINCFSECYNITLNSEKKNQFSNTINEIRNKLLESINELKNVLDYIKIIDDKEVVSKLKSNRIYKTVQKVTLNKFKTKINFLFNNISIIKNKINNLLTFEDKLDNNINTINNFIDNFNEIKYLFGTFNYINKITITQNDYNNLQLLNYFNLSNQLKPIINTDNNLTDDGLLVLFYDKISKLSLKTLNIDDLYVQCKKIYNYFNTNEYDSFNKLKLCLGCIVFLLFGAKRFGDWIQVNLSKKFYFFLQTTDYYCKLYSYLIGAPVLIDNYIYNYLPSENNNNLDQFSLNNNIKIINDGSNGIIYKGLRDVKSKNISRYYFNKYMKYKKKYWKLKSSN